MSYKLRPFPPALFEARGVLRKAAKPQLAHAIITHSKTDHYVLDGGSSLQFGVPWKRVVSYGAIAQSYADFTIRHYGLATVVFDGYSGGPYVKDNTHQRRWQNIHPVVRLTADTEFAGKNDEFMSRDSIKQELIDLINWELRERNCNVINHLVMQTKIFLTLQ